ncbi:MAG TPA: AMP-binding protein [Candidatus Limnocylindrales bacterium]|nr:AMP-binding protein [Candidatus Limnocylindrales bacterium]
MNGATIVPPPAAAASWFPIADADAWRAAAHADPHAYWASFVDGFVWSRRPSRVFEGSMREPHWFADGELNVTESCLDRHAASRPDAIAYHYEREDGASRSISYAELLDEVNRFAGALRADRIGRGDRVVIYIPLSIEAIVAMLACARIGAIHCVVFAGLGSDALGERIRDVGARCVLAGDVTFRRGRAIDLRPILRAALAGAPSVERVVLWRRGPEGPPLHAREADWDAYRAGGTPLRSATIVPAEAPLFVLHTSGTTGKPKGIVHGHGGFLVGGASIFAAMTGLTPDDVFLCTSDVGWMTGHMQMVYGALANRYSSVIREGAPDHPAGDVTYELIERRGITQIYTTPTYARMLLRAGTAAARRYDLSSLRAIYSGGEPLNAPVWRFLFEEVGRGRVAVCQHWGQTETGAPSLGFLPSEPIRPDRTGRGFGPLAFDVVDAEGRTLPAGAEGAFVTRSVWPHMFTGVWNDPERFAAYFDGIPGCYETGDVGRRDADGYFEVLGRADDVFNVAGHLLAPAAIETALLAHPACGEAAAIGIPDALRGEVVKAFVVLRDGYAATDALRSQLRTVVAQRAGPIAAPAVVDFVATIPKTRSGKIMRRLLRARELGTDPGDTSAAED